MADSVVDAANANLNALSLEQQPSALPVSQSPPPPAPGAVPQAPPPHAYPYYAQGYPGAAPPPLAPGAAAPYGHYYPYPYAAHPYPPQPYPAYAPPAAPYPYPGLPGAPPPGLPGMPGMPGMPSLPAAAPSVSTYPQAAPIPPPVNMGALDQKAAIAFAFNEAFKDIALVLACKFSRYPNVRTWYTEIEYALLCDPTTQRYLGAFPAILELRQKILAHDESIVLENRIPDFAAIELNRLWPALSEEEKKRVWVRIENISNHAEVFATHNKHPILQKASAKMLEHWQNTGFDVKAAIQGGRPLDVVFSCADVLEKDSEMRQCLKTAMRAFSDPTNKNSLEDLQGLFSPEQKQMIDTLRSVAEQQDGADHKDGAGSDTDEGSSSSSDSDDEEHTGRAKPSSDAQPGDADQSAAASKHKKQRKKKQSKRKQTHQPHSMSEAELDQTMNRFFNLMQNVKRASNVYTGLRGAGRGSAAPSGQQPGVAVTPPTSAGTPAAGS